MRSLKSTQKSADARSPPPGPPGKKGELSLVSRCLGRLSTPNKKTTPRKSKKALFKINGKLLHTATKAPLSFCFRSLNPSRMCGVGSSFQYRQGIPSPTKEALGQAPPRVCHLRPLNPMGCPPRGAPPPHCEFGGGIPTEGLGGYLKKDPFCARSTKYQK